MSTKEKVFVKTFSEKTILELEKAINEYIKAEKLVFFRLQYLFKHESDENYVKYEAFMTCVKPILGKNPEEE